MPISESDATFLKQIKFDASDDNLQSIIKLFKTKYPSDPEAAAALATLLAASGKFLAPISSAVADVASTGGPSSLSTLLSPLYLRAAGLLVPKLGVPGRPAGGIDCLAQIPGYKTVLDVDQVLSILESGGYAHFLAQGELAPLDGRMFNLRQSSDAQKIPSLVAASLLAKKLAVGVKIAGLDIRVAQHGNFGENWEIATNNAILFEKTAEMLGIKAFPVLTDARHLYQPYIGRRESLMALQDFFENTATEWLEEHCITCKSLALTCVPEESRLCAAKAPRSSLRQHFEQNLMDQGADPRDYHALVMATKKEHKNFLVAKHAGFCFYDLSKLRNILLKFQKAFDCYGEEFPDPVGIKFMTRSGTYVENGTVLASFRAPDKSIVEVSCELEKLICEPKSMPYGHNIEAINGKK